MFHVWTGKFRNTAIESKTDLITFESLLQHRKWNSGLSPEQEKI